jgi:hypothetical protein
MIRPSKKQDEASKATPHPTSIFSHSYVDDGTRCLDPLRMGWLIHHSKFQSPDTVRFLLFRHEDKQKCREITDITVFKMCRCVGIALVPSSIHGEKEFHVQCLVLALPHFPLILIVVLDDPEVFKLPGVTFVHVLGEQLPASLKGSPPSFDAEYGPKILSADRQDALEIHIVRLHNALVRIF